VTITVEIKPEIQAELARQAAVRGRALEAHAARLLEEAAQRAVDESSATEFRDGKMGLVEVCAMVSGLTDDVDFGRGASADRPVELQ